LGIRLLFDTAALQATPSILVRVDPARKRSHVPSRSHNLDECGAALGLRNILLQTWTEKLPWTLDVAPRKAFHLRRRVPRERAAHFDEIDPSPRGYVTSVVVDVDRTAAGTAWLEAGVPQPSFLVRSDRGHAHLVWLLERWVRRDNKRAMRLLDVVQAAFTIACDGDRAYAGPMHHNPLSATYSTIIGHRDDFTLHELAECVPDLLLTASTSSTHTKSGFRDEFAAAGRNCHVFETVRFRAYRAIAAFKERRAYEPWLEHVTALVTAENATNAQPVPASEVRSIAKSIASWTWDVYKGDFGAARPRRRRYELDRHQYLGQVNARRQRALNLYSKGLSLASIAMTIGVTRRTVCRYLKTSTTRHRAGDKSENIRIAPCARVSGLIAGSTFPAPQQQRFHSSHVTAALERCSSTQTDADRRRRRRRCTSTRTTQLDADDEADCLRT
jgi:hypothetical protein